ncbi:hypothetical protein [Pararhodobacter oceanensis]|uniref:DUF1127 domain-containing protein n=1 Tax=Pararhodobacter oceanensis TaxID=2172121 RepID=A0A2T8HXM4_9RHOB|nr:hypothetical protein [Pararhodobacter oceanensis]PVH30154.1 hypothetical protein DDE20_00880 [Pararhodobacter oceanensis]
MAFNTHTVKPAGSPAVSAAIAALSRFGGKIKTQAQHLSKAIQLARMMSVLANMSDDHLELIGVTRSEIPAYAEKLLAGE